MPTDPVKVGDEITIKTAEHRADAEGETIYEIDPVTYAGPWRLPVGTQLRVVKVPGDSDQQQA